MADDRDVTPDDSLLKAIFGTSQPKNISIFLQLWDKCVFKAEFPKGLNDHSTCVVRLEAEDKSAATFNTIAALQQIAATIIPELVPQTFQIGKAQNAQGRTFRFSVVEFIQGDLLEDVWEQLSAEEQTSVVGELVEALKKLHSARLSDEMVQEILIKTLREGGDNILGFNHLNAFGGPETGFSNDGPALLDSYLERLKLSEPFCTINFTESQDMRIQSIYEELGSTVMKKSDIDKWAEESVLCHNDINPRNLLIRSHTSSDGKSKYKLAAIIDWELAGFYPPSYELSLQDTYLGGDRYLSFYLLLKQHLKDIVPRSSSQIALLRAMEFIWVSQQRSLINGSNVGALVRKRFIEMTKLARDGDPYTGWTRIPQEEPYCEFSSAAFQKLEDNMVEKMLASRNSKVPKVR